MNTYIYIRVLEARGIIRSNQNAQPLVVIKYNGSEFYDKKRTKSQSGVEWWDKSFRFKIRDVNFDWFTVQIRDKSLATFGSSWLGEVQLQVVGFQEQLVTDCWYRLGNSLWKAHNRTPVGCVHLMIQITRGKFERPFTVAPEPLRFENWEALGCPMPGQKFVNPHIYNFENAGRYELIYPTIQDARTTVKKNAIGIVLSEKVSGTDLQQMTRLNKVNCLHKGDFESCAGKRFLICVDGSPSSFQAFESALKLIEPEKDHLFFVTVRERVSPRTIYEQQYSEVLRHKIWRAAAGISCYFQERLKDSNISFTSMIPEADDARSLVCALVKRYKIDVLVVGKHKPGELRYKSGRWISFQKYCQSKAKCTVITF